VTSLTRLRSDLVSSSRTFSFDYDSAPKDLARLDCNECFVPPDEEERASMVQALSEVNLNRYPDVTARPLREAFARYLGIRSDELLLANGSVETIGIVIEAFCVGKAGGGKVLIPEPTFPLFRSIAEHHGARALGVPLRPDFSLDEDKLKRTLELEDPDVTFVVSPNNPTGNRFDPDAIVRLSERATGAFVVDEAYADFDGQSFVAHSRATPGFFVMRSLSKVGFAGLRIGALIGHSKAIFELDKLRIPWNVDAVAMALGSVALAHPLKLKHRLDTVSRARLELLQALSKIPGLIVYPSAANFLLVRVPSDAHGVARSLLEQNVLVRDVSAPGLLENCLRISVGAPADNERCVKSLLIALRG
jgi:histidinol-phosphate aminotransferase